MRSSIVRWFAILSLCVSPGLVAVFAQGPLQVTIPFHFTVGEQSFSAGDYYVRQQSPAVLSVQRADGRAAMFAFVRSGKRQGTPDKAYLMFNRIGDHYVLSQVSDSIRYWDLPPSKIEKELLAKASAAAEPLVVIASRMK